MFASVGRSLWGQAQSMREEETERLIQVEREPGEAHPSLADKRKAIALKVGIVVLAALVLYGASVGLGAVATAIVAKKLVVAWQFGALNGAILGLKASAVALPFIARKSNMFSYTKDNLGDTKRFLKNIAKTTAALTAIGTVIGALAPSSICKLMGYKPYLLEANNPIINHMPTNTWVVRNGELEQVTELFSEITPTRDYFLFGDIPRRGLVSSLSELWAYQNLFMRTGNL